MEQWFKQHVERYSIVVAENEGSIVGWASLNPYNNRCAYAGVGDLSVYIAREYRGRGIGSLLLKAIEEAARKNGFHKIILYTFPFNEMGQKLYAKNGFREVGTFQKHGILDGNSSMSWQWKNSCSNND